MCCGEHSRDASDSSLSSQNDCFQESCELWSDHVCLCVCVRGCMGHIFKQFPPSYTQFGEATQRNKHIPSTTIANDYAEI